MSDTSSVVDYFLDKLTVDTGGRVVTVGLKNAFDTTSATQRTPAETVVSTFYERDRDRTVI